MLVIREEQMKVLEEAVSSKFESEMIKHLKEYAPELFKLRGEPCFRQSIRTGMQRSKDRYGFTNRGPVRLYIELMFSLGFDFDTDPQYPWAHVILADVEESDQMARADQLYREATAYRNFAMGSQYEYAISAMGRLNNAYGLIQRLSSSDMKTKLIDGMYGFFPEKSAYVGEEQLQMLIDEAVCCAGQFDMSSAEACGLITLLFFAVGHGAAWDPLYPWINETLTMVKHPRKADRFAVLLSRTRAYFDATLRHLISITNAESDGG